MPTFYSKINVSSEVRTTNFWSGRSGFESLSCQIFLWFHWNLSEFPIVPMAQWAGKQGSEAISMGSNPSRYLHFQILLIRRRIVMTPLMHDKFQYQNVSETREGSPTKLFCTVRQTNFDKIVIPAPLSIIFFRYQNFSETREGSSTKLLGTVRQKNFDGKLWYPLPPSHPWKFFDSKRVPLRSF